MLARRERHVGRDLVVVVVVFFARRCGRHRDLVGEFLAIERHLEAGGRTCGSHGGKEGVFTGFSHVDGVFEPVAFVVVAHHDAGSLLVQVDAGIRAVIGIAMIFRIGIGIGLVRSTVFVLALARNIEVFGFNLARNGNRFTLERKLRFRINGLSTDKSSRIDTLVLGEVILEPSHGRAVATTILDDTRVSVRGPSGTVNVAPNSDTGNMLVFHEQGNLFRVALLLGLVIIRTDIVFGNEHRRLRFLPDFIKNALQGIEAQASAATTGTTGTATLSHHVVGLQAVSIDRSTIFLDGLDQLDTFVLLPLDSIVVIINQDSFRPTFTRHLEGRGHEGIVSVVVATESLDDLGVGIAGVVLVVSGTDGFVHHVNHFEVGEFPLDGVKPVSNSLLGVIGTQIAKPVRVLRAPHESVELEVATVVLCPVIGSLTATEVTIATGTFDRGPFTFVFGGNLVPVGSKVRTHLATCSNVTNELRSAIGQAGPCERDRRRRKSDRCGLSN